MSFSGSKRIEFRDDWLVPGREFLQPDWEAISDWVESQFLEEEEGEVLGDFARAWILGICKQLGDDYRLRESEHFMLASVASDQKAVELLQFLERCYDQTRESLPCLVEEDPDGKCPVIVIADRSRFYDYLDDFVGEGGGEYGAVGGVYLNRGWGHFVVPSVDLREYQSVFSHELSHALVDHLRLPSWLNEAIAMTVEYCVAKSSPYILDREIVEQHQGYWTEERIQGFWRGESFWYSDEGQGLSYHLAQFILNAFYQGGSTPPGLINDFIQAAGGSADAGCSAAREVLGIEVGELLERLLGSGEWEPVVVGQVD